MKKWTHAVAPAILALGVLFIGWGALAPIGAKANVPARDPGIDFRTVKGQDAAQFLTGRGFILERDADEDDVTKLSLTDKGLEIEALSEGQAMIGLKKGYLENYQDIEIVWGVNKFPEGASYAAGKRNEAVMFYAFFGKEMIDSGSMVVPDSPYFIALHLCQNDEINKPEKGMFFHDGGRFICVAHPKPGEVVTTRFNLRQAFKDIYGHDAPPLYGVAFEFDTNDAPDDGKASAFVQSVFFPEADYVRQ